MVSRPIKVAIAEDHALERSGIISLLKDYDDIEIVLDKPNGLELLEGLKSVEPDIVLLDIRMPVMGGRTTFDKIRSRHPAIKIIMLSGHSESSYIVDFVRKGAASFLSKNSRIEKVVETIRGVFLKGSFYDSITATMLARASDFKNKKTSKRDDLGLTSREVEVIRFVCMGKENSEIATLCAIDIRTVEGYRSSIWEKTGCKNVVELIEYAFKHNILEL